MELNNTGSRTLRSGILGVCQTNWMYRPAVPPVVRKVGLSGLMWAGTLSCCNLMTISL